jgi:hypothetical protein
MGHEPTDAGKTSGGGSLGHDQPARVTEEAPIRNHPSPRDDGREAPDRKRPDDPVMPSDDSALNTRI